MAVSKVFSISEPIFHSQNADFKETCDGNYPWTTIIVNQIPMNVDENKLLSIFSRYGAIEDTYMCHAKRRRQRKHERMAKLVFRNEDDAWKVWEASKNKLLRYEDQVLMITLASEDYSPIQCLNDICLREIFLHVHSIKDKLLLEMVCKRWKNNGRCCWSNITQIGTDHWHFTTWSMILSRVEKSLKNVELCLRNDKVECLGAVAEHCNCLRGLICELCHTRDTGNTPCNHYIQTILQKNRKLEKLRFHCNGSCDMHTNMQAFPAELAEIDLFIVGRSVIPLTVALSNFPNLRILRLRGFNITDQQLINDVIHLERLSLIRCDMPEYVFSRIVSSNRGIKYLHLAMDNLTEASFIHVQRLPNLQVLVVNSEQFTDAYLGEMPRLKALNCCSCHSITDEGVRNFFSSATDIRVVGFADCSITLDSVVIAKEWTKRTHKSLKLCIDDDLFKKYLDLKWENSEMLQVVEWDASEINDALKEGGWNLDIIV